MIARAHPPADRRSVDPVWRLAGPVLAAAVFLAPYVSWRPTDLLFTFSDGLFVLGAALLVASRTLPFAPFGAWTPLWLLAVSAMLGGLLLGSLVNGDPERWLIGAAQYSLSFILLPMLLVAQGPTRTILLMRSAVAGVFAMELFGIIVYHTVEPTYASYLRFGHDFVTGAGRLGVFLGDANWNACVIAMTLALTLYLRLRGHMSRLAFVAVLAVLCYALLLAASVTGIVSALIGVALFAAIGRVGPSPKLIAALLVGWFALASLGVGVPRVFYDRVVNAVETGDVHAAGTFTGRAELIEEAWEMVEDIGLVGLGVDQYRVVSPYGAPVHNIYLLLWAEGGLVALAGWLAMIALLAGAAITAGRVDRFASALGLSVLSTFVIFSNAAPHMYARLWIVPLLLAMALPMAIAAAQRPGSKWRYRFGSAARVWERTA